MMYTINVVDPSTVTRRTVSTQLERYGFTAIMAESTDRARHMLATRPVDLLILGLGIMDLDGIALLQELRRNRSYHSLPIVVLTASGHERDQIDARSAGATAFLTKPVSTVELIKTVNGALGIPGYPQRLSRLDSASQASWR